MRLPVDHCIVCRAPLTPHQRFSGGLCADWRCREARLNEALRAHRREAAAAMEVKDPESFEPVVVPFGSRSVVRLSTERRSEFLKVLKEVLDESFATPKQEVLASLEGPEDLFLLTQIALAESVAARVCAACGGVCCYHGGYKHAFLDIEAIGFLRSKMPDLTPEEILTLYHGYLPREHFGGACVFQGRQGCVLPRDLRAPICNGYQCKGLKEAVRLEGKNPGTKFIVIAREDNRIIRSVFVEGLGSQR